MITASHSLRRIQCSIALVALAMNAHATLTDISTTPLNTYWAPSSTDVKPNVLFVLDDSGSMDWTYMPDQVGSYSATSHWYRNSAFNGVAYNPAVTYKPPVYYNADGSLNTATYPNMDGTSAARGGDGTATAGSPNWKAVPRDGYGIQSTSVSDLVNNAYAYVIVPGEYCTSPKLTNCVAASAPTGSYTYPARLRWCTDSGLTTCRATYDPTTYSFPRIASPRTATITVSGNTNTSVSHITVDGKEILSGTTSASSVPSNVATNIRNAINNCTNSITGNCTIAGYSATVAGDVVTITSPVAVSTIPTVTIGSGTMAFTATNFAQGSVPGENLRHTIVSSALVAGYAYPGTNAKASSRTDCAGTTCTYAEEMTNYANYWAYYRTRMQMMKTATSIAFSKIDTGTDLVNNVSRFRVGYLSINNNTTNDYLNLGEFKTSQKNAWYDKLFSADPNNWTPLREALSTAGRLYGGKLNGTTLNGSTVEDPLQYSCQKNYTILSTDGFWNGSSGYKLSGTGMDNQDAALAPPYNDGGTANIQEKTSQLQSQTTQLRTRTRQLQERTSTLQTRTSLLQARTSSLQFRAYSQLQTRTSSNSGTSWTGWSNTASCTWDTTGTSRRECQYNGTSWTGWSNTSSCTPHAVDTNATHGITWAPGVECQYSDWTAWSNTGSCTPLAQDTSSPWTVGTARQCQYTDWTDWADTTSCTPLAQDTSSPWDVGTARQCQYTAWTPFADTASCDAVAQDTTSPWTVGTARQCQWTAWSNYAGTPTCTAIVADTSDPFDGNTGSNGLARECSSTVSSPYANTSSCTATTTPDANGYTTQCQYTSWTSWTTVASCTAESQSTAPNYTVATARQCQTLTSGGTSNTLADVAAYYYNKDLRSPTATGADATGTCDGPIIPPSTTPTNLCTDNVKASGLDVATTQHMTTFTLGLGATGQMLFSPTYWSDLSGDFYDVKVGTTASPSTGVCPWMSSGTTCTWPIPSSDSINNIDDLWHAAVNGHGNYFSATDPASLATGLSETLQAIAGLETYGTAAAAVTSNPNISSDDNYLFSSYYQSPHWYGDVTRRDIDSASGAIGDVKWSAMTLLDCATTEWKPMSNYSAGDVFRNGTNCYRVTTNYVSGSAFGSTDTDNTSQVVDPDASPVVASTSRTIYTKGSSGLVAFTWTDLVAESLDSYFTTPAITYTSPTSGLSQFCPTGTNCLSADQQSNTTIATGGAAGEALVNFLRGDRTFESTLFHKRTHVLGDIVSSMARYVKTPLLGYSDANFSAFKTAMESRDGMVYVAANDGMLHAFEAQTGQEAWAYIPSFVLPNLYKLADKNYETQHQFLLDGSPESGDICPNAPTSTCDADEWKTILVGGMNRGGKGYFALDVTNPASPELLWEFSDANLGYAYSNPRITKLQDGTWVVIFASGYNNADGVGRLYVLNAHTGTLIHTISTGVGSSSAPSGLARISAYSPTTATDNTTLAVYGGDLLGNLWRFDINNGIGAAGYDAQLLVTFTDPSGNPQPITAKPVVSVIDGHPVVFVGTGRYLGINDLTNTQIESFYAVKDTFEASTLNAPRNPGSGFVSQTLTAGTCPASAPTSWCVPSQSVRSTTSNLVNWGTDNGWYIDFVTGGERSTTDASLVRGALLFTTIYPNTSSANVCGDTTTGTGASYLYALDFRTGAALLPNAAAVSLGGVVATAATAFVTSDGTVHVISRGTTLDGQPPGDFLKDPPIYTPSTTRRVSWRELVNE